MKRRNFIRTTVVGSSMMATSGLLSFTQVAQINNEYGDLINPIIPLKFFPNLEKEMLSYIVELNKLYGFRRFVITGPSKEHRYTGFPEKQVFIELGEQILQLTSSTPLTKWIPQPFRL